MKLEKFYQKIVDHPKLILVIYCVLFILCAMGKQFVAINYDMNDYLSADAPSTVALDTMNEEFEGGIPNARVMIGNVSVPEALQYKAKIEAIDGVSVVTWLDDAVSVTVPLEMQDPDTVETYYKDGNALYSVTIDEDKRIEAVNAIRALIGEENQMTGSAVSTATATQSTVHEISKIAVFAVIFVIIVLLITTTSWLEPFIVLLGLGVAIVINAGSNLLFGEISFVTNAAGNILQLAVSLDYSVFLLHRFTECREHHENAKDAMVEALCMSISSILSSGLTTVIGFLALCLMQFEIGPDLGRALAKGIAISLVTVFTFMPVVILYTFRWIDKTGHRPLLPSFEKFGKIVTKVMLPAVIVFAVVIVPAYLASNANSFYYGASHIFGPKTQLGRDTQTIEEAFGKSDTYVLMVSKSDLATQKELSDELHDMDEVSGIISYVDTVGEEVPESYLDAAILKKLMSDRYARMVISVRAESEGDATFTLVKNIRACAEKYYPGEWYFAGEGVSTCDLMDTITSDMAKVNLVAIGAVFFALLLTMRSLVLPVILVLSIETAVWLNFAIPYFSGSSIFYIAYLIISSIQLGVTVSSTTVSILTSGSIMTMVGFLLGVISTHGLLSQLGFFLGKGTLLSLMIVFFALPGLLYLFDGVFIRKKGVRNHEKQE